MSDTLRLDAEGDTGPPGPTGPGLESVPGQTPVACQQGWPGAPVLRGLRRRPCGVVLRPARANGKVETPVLDGRDPGVRSLRWRSFGRPHPYSPATPSRRGTVGQRVTYDPGPRDSGHNGPFTEKRSGTTPNSGHGNPMRSLGRLRSSNHPLSPTIPRSLFLSRERPGT